LTAGVLLVVALTVATPTGGAGADARRGAPAWVCVDRPIERSDAETRPLFVFIGPGADGMRAQGALREGRKLCAQVAAGAIVVDVRTSPDERTPASELCASPLRLRLAPEVFLHVSVSRSPPTPSLPCPWTMLHSIDDPTVPRKNELADVDFVILPAFESYDEARHLAEGTAARLGLRLDLRGALPDGHRHLTFSKAACAANKRSYPCYVPRGPDAGSYVSIEDGARIFGCGPSGYVVVLASGPKGDAGVQATLEKARKLFPAATIVTDEVSTLGCIGAAPSRSRR
jgi:hypothetical protein